MPDRIVVIGSNSFSGASFIKYALEEGHEVLGISRSAENNPSLLPYKWTPTERFEFKQLDLNKHTDEIISEIANFKAPYVVNFAAQAMVAESWENPHHWYQTNIVANARLHDKLRNTVQLKKYLHVSTPEVYGSCSGLVDETYPYSPSTPYATSRAACDMHLLNFHNNYSFPVVFTRAANVYGPGQQLFRIIPRSILFIKLGKKLKLHGGGKSLRSFIHIQDVARGTLKVLLEGSPPDIFHLSTDQHISIYDLVKMICEEMQTDIDDFIERSPDRPGKDSAYLLNCKKIEIAFGWSPQIALHQGIKETIDWIDKSFDALKKESYEYIHKE